MDSQNIYSIVKERYSALTSDTARTSGEYSKAVAQSFGYTEDELQSIPTQANLGLSCGNPLAIASLRQGETVIDLGSGAGFDVFLAARKVGLSGRAIGVDMNEDMLSLAEKNKANSGASNVEFIKAGITNIPLDDSIADVIISNCVINLVPENEKHLVFKEIYRLLKPGGRVAVSDILAKKPLPEKIQKCAAAYVGCVAGASLVSQYHAYFEQAGFADVVIQNANNDLNVYIDALPEETAQDKDGGDDSKQTPNCCAADPALSTCCSPEQKASGCCAPDTNDNGCCTTTETTGQNLDLSGLVADIGKLDLNEWVASYKIFAVKLSK